MHESLSQLEIAFSVLYHLGIVLDERDRTDYSVEQNLLVLYLDYQVIVLDVVALQYSVDSFGKWHPLVMEICELVATLLFQQHPVEVTIFEMLDLLFKDLWFLILLQINQALDLVTLKPDIELLHID